MIRKNCICVCLYVLFVFWDISAMKIQLDTLGIGVLGGNETKLLCSFVAESTEEVVSLQILTTHGTNTFIPIALFKPNGDANLSYTGGYLIDRVELINSIQLSRQITMKFTVLICGDGKEYRCRITYFANFNQLMMETESKKIIINVSPLKPENVLLVNSTQHFVEGTAVTFICYGNVGNPPGKFVWQKIRKYNPAVIQYLDVPTEKTEVSESCTYNGTSVLTVTLNAEDNEGIMRCAVQSMTALYQDSQPVNVFYKVRKPSINKYPDREVYVVGSGDIQLTCNADGNPDSHYIWRKEDNTTQSLSLNASLVIDTMHINNSGIFVCYAFNNLSGNKYDKKETVDIEIVNTISESFTSVPGTDATLGLEIGLGIGIPALIIIVVVICLLYRRHQKSTDLEKNENTDLDKKKPNETSNTTNTDAEKKGNADLDKTKENETSKTTNTDEEKKGNADLDKTKENETSKTTNTNAEKKGNADVDKTKENETSKTTNTDAEKKGNADLDKTKENETSKTTNTEAEKKITQT